ncbi:hypothetical protein [Flagellimonas eckloniae]|uniref:Peptidase M10 metallopeptidase domain-containing protein n=1 Tax=Flagellimonas eckloniae TaxID=346185 RepID=A0A0Q1DLX3_9FLAO|nr:hypothetical protein [Allomuricauda eckloniae]KQC29977.1 hypothetical protein AAY42_08880 [Allomuricauda eckloniae]
MKFPYSLGWQSKRFLKLVLILVFLSGCSESPNDPTNIDPEVIIEEEEEEGYSTIELNLRVHLMQDITMVHPTGWIMESWVTPEDVTKTIMPELNSIWEKAGVHWNVESIIEENVVKGETYQESLVFIVNAVRNSNGNSDPERLPHLYSLMQPEHRSTEEQLEKNLFHIYLFPFIGNTSQGNAMSGFGYHSVVGTYTNKHNGGGVPEKTLLTESQSYFNRGSLSRTIAHEIGHVLNLNHNECNDRCLMGGINSDGYLLTEGQIITSRIEAVGRSFD